MAAHRPATFKRLYSELLGSVGVKVVWHGKGEPSDEIPDPWRALLPAPTRTSRIKRARPGRRGYSDEHYRDVAAAYRKAQRTHPRAPIQALMAELHTTEPTVHRWLKTARARGFLQGEEK